MDWYPPELQDEGMATWTQVEDEVPEIARVGARLWGSLKALDRGEVISGPGPCFRLPTSPPFGEMAQRGCTHSVPSWLEGGYLLRSRDLHRRAGTYVAMLVARFTPCPVLTTTSCASVPRLTSVPPTRL